jgi:hypothetical protein
LNRLSYAKQALGLAITVALATSLTACGGGGSTPAPTYANTSLSYYVPLASGNRWTFSNGSSMVDAGAGVLQCSCTANGITIEGVNLLDSSSTYVGTFFFAKGQTSNGYTTALMGSSTDHGTTISVIQSSTSTGIGIMSDTPKVGQTWSYTNEVSTITAIEGTQALGSLTINHVATDSLVEATGTIGWSFAKGVGITSLSSGGKTVNLADFAVNVQTSQSELRASAAIRPSTIHIVPSGVEAAALLKSLL